MLKMKKKCERCAAPLPLDGEALICSFECSFCAGCSAEMDRICPNCGGELHLRPPRVITPIQALTKRLTGGGNRVR